MDRDGVGVKAALALSVISFMASFLYSDGQIMFAQRDGRNGFYGPEQQRL